MPVVVSERRPLCCSIESNQYRGCSAAYHREYGGSEVSQNARLKSAQLIGTVNKDRVNGVYPAAHLIGGESLNERLPYNYADHVQAAGNCKRGER